MIAREDGGTDAGDLMRRSARVSQETDADEHLDFSLVYVLNEADQIVDMLIDKRGAKAAR